MTKIVYWAPWDYPKLYSNIYLSYTDPTNLNEELAAKSNNDNKLDNFFRCPAFVNNIKNTYVFKSPANCDVEFKENYIVNKMPDSVPWEQHILQFKQPSMYNAYTVKFNAHWIFFSEDELEIDATPPYLHNSQVSNHGYYVPGSFDISSWFRPLEYAFQLKEQHNQFKVRQDDPLLYIRFKTQEPVKLKKFYLTESLFNHSMSCIKLKIYRRERNLKNLYGIFHKSKLRNMILSEIKENLV
jgi:hypothetical protein